MSKRYVFILAILLLLTFFGLEETVGGLFISFGRMFNYQSAGELRFWLGSVLLIFPASCFLGWVFEKQILSIIKTVSQRLQSISNQMGRIFLLVFLGSLAFALIGKNLILNGHPITDDELGSIFGSKIWLSGSLTIPVPEPFPAFQRQFMFIRDGRLANMDWPGNIAAWALDQLLFLNGGIFSLAAAISATALTLVIWSRLSMGWALLGLIFFWFSPMASSLSFTTHQHQLSRAAFALLITAVWFAHRHKKQWIWCLAGAMGGIMGLSRPMETFFLSLPIVFFLIRRCFRAETKEAKRDFAYFFIGTLPFVLIFAWYNYQLTGHWWLPPRFAIPQAATGASDVFNLQKIWVRFGANTGANLFLLMFWPLGPLGFLLVLAGISHDWLTKILGWGIVCDLILGLLHDVYGIHIVGPIHYSECIIPIVLISVHGFRNILSKLSIVPQWESLAKSCGISAIVLGLAIFNFHQWSALHDSAKISDTIFGYIEIRLAELQRNRPNDSPSVIVAPPYLKVWENIPPFRERGTWVYEWPTFSPDFNDSIIFAPPGFEKDLLKRFQGRNFYRLVLKQGAPVMDLVPF